MYVTVKQQNSLYLKNRITSKERKSKIFEEPLKIKRNLFIGAQSAQDE